ncbi:hypothetical protein EMIT0P171_30378 [Pseudomonas sp. IT-P171]
MSISACEPPASRSRKDLSSLDTVQGALGKTTKTNQLVVSGAYTELLVGGPYTRDSKFRIGVCRELEA